MAPRVGIIANAHDGKGPAVVIETHDVFVLDAGQRHGFNPDGHRPAVLP